MKLAHDSLECERCPFTRLLTVAAGFLRNDNLAKMASKKLSFGEFTKTVEQILEGLKSHGIRQLSTEQKEALFWFVSGEDTFAVLPTGHGKSLVYQMSVLYAKKVCANPVVVVISPLNALISDQIRECERLSLKAVKLEASNVEALRKECEYDVVFSSAEVLESFPAKTFLQTLGSRIVGIVVDESHCVVKW